MLFSSELSLLFLLFNNIVGTYGQILILCRNKMMESYWKESLDVIIIPLEHACEGSLPEERILETEPVLSSFASSRF